MQLVYHDFIWPSHILLEALGRLSHSTAITEVDVVLSSKLGEGLNTQLVWRVFLFTPPLTTTSAAAAAATSLLSLVDVRFFCFRFSFHPVSFPPFVTLISPIGHVELYARPLLLLVVSNALRARPMTFDHFRPNGCCETWLPGRASLVSLSRSVLINRLGKHLHSYLVC